MPRKAGAPPRVYADQLLIGPSRDAYRHLVPIHDDGTRVPAWWVNGEGPYCATCKERPYAVRPCGHIVVVIESGELPTGSRCRTCFGLLRPTKEDPPCAPSN